MKNPLLYRSAWPESSRVARARAEGYKGAGGKPVPYHGYYTGCSPDRGKTLQGVLTII
jgi:hypothetical protein